MNRFVTSLALAGMLGLSGVASAQNYGAGVNGSLTFGAGKPTQGSVGASGTVESKNGKTSITGSTQTQLGNGQTGRTTVNVNVQKK